MTRRRMVVPVACVLLITAVAARAKGMANHAAGPNWRVDIDEVRPLGNSSRAGYAIHLSYEFSGAGLVWLDGVGEVEPRGELRYAIQRDQVVFRSSRRDKPVARVRLEPTIYSQPAPHGDDYPATAGGPSWSTAPAMTAPIDAKKAALLLNDLLYQESKHLPKPCRPMDGGCWLTPWTRIATDGYSDGEIAVMLLFADNNGQPPTTINILFFKRQGYKGSAGYENDGELISKAAGPFMTRLRDTISQRARQ